MTVKARADGTVTKVSDGANGTMLYGACDTAAATAAKATASDVSGFALTSGVTVSVRFTQANTADAPTLNVNGTGDVPILTNGTNAAYWEAGAGVTFVYNGTGWVCCSSPVYASEATIGNPTGSNVFLAAARMALRHALTEVASFGERVVSLCSGTTKLKAEHETGFSAAFFGTTNPSDMGGIYLTRDVDNFTGNTINDATRGCLGIDKGNGGKTAAHLCAQTITVMPSDTTHGGTYDMERLATAICPTVLYDSSTGTTGAVPLSEDVSHFRELTIVYRASMVAGPKGGNKSVTVPVYGTTYVQLDCVKWDNDGRDLCQFVSSCYQATGTTLSYVSRVYGQIYTGSNAGTFGGTDGGQMCIIRVTGRR